MSFFENTRNPVGLGGKIMVALMNLGHSPVARWGLRFLDHTPDAEVLDCGCGGMTIHKNAELKAYPELSGFHKVQIHKKKSRLCVTALK